jgi:hypothetical protein
MRRSEKPLRMMDASAINAKKAGVFDSNLTDIKGYLNNLYKSLLPGGKGGGNLVWPEGLIVELIDSEGVGEVDQGVLRVQWSHPSFEANMLPAWEFPWEKGLNDYQARRFVECMEWVRIRTGDPWVPYGRISIHSRCAKVEVNLPTLNNQSASFAVCDIVYLKADGGMTYVFSGHQGHQINRMVDMSIGRCEARLHAFGFLRIHRCYIVNLGCIRAFYAAHGECHVTLCNGVALPVARRRRKNVQLFVEMVAPQHGTVHHKLI